MRKICVVTTCRAEYGLLFWLMKEIQADPELQLQLVVTGTHLSPEFGSTVNLIREDGFRIDRQFDLQLKGDKVTDITHSLAVALDGFASAFHTLRPDLIVLLGDRFEILGAATAALIANVQWPTSWRRISLGAIDDSIRHAVTKMAHLHFVAAMDYRDRVIRMGEHPDRCFWLEAWGSTISIGSSFWSGKNLSRPLDYTREKESANHLSSRHHQPRCCRQSDGGDPESPYSAQGYPSDLSPTQTRHRYKAIVEKIKFLCAIIAIVPS
jgi:UDP-hydrolysing UDP-N-acetyl-D-glucosamine 2-epimerase